MGAMRAKLMKVGGGVQEVKGVRKVVGLGGGLFEWEVVEDWSMRAFTSKQGLRHSCGVSPKGWSDAFCF